MKKNQWYWPLWASLFPVIWMGSGCNKIETTIPTLTLGSGPIQATLRWNTTDDLDLAITDPTGETVFFSNRQIASGGTLDVDANAACSNVTTNPVENIFWNTTPPAGTYTVEVNLFQRCSTSAAAIPYTLNVIVNGEVQTISNTVTTDDQTNAVSFEYSSSTPTPTTASSPTP